MYDLLHLAQLLGVPYADVIDAADELGVKRLTISMGRPHVSHVSAASIATELGATL